MKGKNHPTDPNLTLRSDRERENSEEREEREGQERA